jgi:multidrug efflux pump subunit AcrB
MKGMFYDCLMDFPWTITINLMISLLLSVSVMPFLLILIIKPGSVNTNGNAITNFVQNSYNKVLDFTFRKPWTTISLGLASILVSLLIIPTLKIRLFPYADRNQFAVEIFLPDGKGLHETRIIADSVYNAMHKDERITGITSFIGCSSPRFMDAYAPQMAGDNYAQFIVNTKSDKATLDLLAYWQPKLSDAFPNAYVKFKRLDYLEVNELEYRFYGENIDSLHLAAERLMERISKMSELEWVHTDYYKPYPIVNVNLDPASAAQLGITRLGAQLSINSAIGEAKVGQIWEGDYQVPIVIKEEKDIKFSDIQNLGISSPLTILSGSMDKNTTVPLRQIANVKPEWSESRIVRRAGERCITVTGHFAQGVYTSEVENEIARIMYEDIKIPEGVRPEVGGEIEYGNEALPQIFWGITIAMIIVFFFLLFNFKKYGITIVCMSALGLMIPGALIGLGLMDRSLGLTSIFGLITLMGIIMRNEILIFEHAIDLINKYIKENGDWTVDKESYNNAVKQAAYEAGKRRMVPIFLTTATTAVGVVPMIIAQSSFWMPVGVTIFAGGIGSLILVVTMLPVIYWKVSTK